MKRILFTGANGFLGKILQEKLKNDYLISSIGRSSINDLIYDLSVEVPQLNNDFDIVIHAAGKAHSVPKNPKEEQEFYQVNFEGTKNLCLSLIKNNTKPQSFIFISTVAVYGKTSGSMIVEDSKLEGSSPYAISKIKAESWLKNWAIENQIVLSILRLPLVAGPNPPGNLGAMISGIKTGRYLSIGDASARKSIVWAEDLANIIPLLTTKGGIYNLTDGYHPNFKELENKISKLLHKNQPIKIPLFLAKMLGFAGDMIGYKFPINSDKINKITSSLTFDDSKAIKVLNWNPSNVLEKVEEMV